MPGRWGPSDGEGSGSRWSGAEERDKRDRQREERARQTGGTKYDPAHSRFAEPPPPPPPPEEPRPRRRRLSEDERQSIRKWRTGARVEPGPTAPSDDPPRTRNRLTGGGRNGPPSLPDLPDEDDGDSGRRRGPSNRMLILGAVLLLIVVLILVVPSGLLSGLGGAKPTPTPARVLNLTPTATTRNPQLALTTPAGGGEHGIVCIDPGHGGWDPGFTRLSDSRAPEMREADINLAMAWMLREKLQAQGFTVVMTRESAAPANLFSQDVNGDGKTIEFYQSGDKAGQPIESTMQDGQRDEFQARINVCNNAKADLMISMHINGYTDGSARGYEIWYTKERPFGDKSETFANYIYRELKQGYDSVGFQTDARGVKPDDEANADLHGYGTEKHYIMIGPAIPGPVGQITPSNMPGAIAEPAFLSNDDDAAFLADPKNQGVIVDAYDRAILQYFQTYPAQPGR